MGVEWWLPEIGKNGGEGEMGWRYSMGAKLQLGAQNASILLHSVLTIGNDNLEATL